MKKIFCVVGTRPEVIKMAPLIKQLKGKCDLTVISTGQHREMLDQALEIFGLVPDIDLNLMKENQTLTDFLSEGIKKLSDVLTYNRPDILVAQGDTTTVLASAHAAYYNKISFAHVEAGLRSFNLLNPWPEEMNRILISRLAKIHFCPTHTAAKNLNLEGITDNVYVTGNTVIDALLSQVNSTISKKNKILVTIHRRENFGDPLLEVISALKTISKLYPDIQIVIPVHLNPNIRNTIYQKLSNLQNINLVEPMSYVDFVNHMASSKIILTDSGGVQEEAPALGVPVLVLRDFTERPEAVEAGVVKLVGTKSTTIVNSIVELLTNNDLYNKMAVGASPYGDGLASIRIAKILCEL